ncbi:MAG TPA: ribonuclease P protein component, partial [Thermodesulfovibrionales bacterium]|nr:ribonuclease P protein component [Thermodesulfovibrionales bacterium]
MRSLTRRRDFDFVFKEGSSAATKSLVIYARPNELDFCRLGLSVSKKIGKAVTRNRVKRLLREAMRKMSGDIPLH